MSVFRHCLCYGTNILTFRRNTLPPDSGRKWRRLVVLNVAKFLSDYKNQIPRSINHNQT